MESRSHGLVRVAGVDRPLVGREGYEGRPGVQVA
jgi:hypothetical protein